MLLEHGRVRGSRRGSLQGLGFDFGSELSSIGGDIGNFFGGAADAGAGLQSQGLAPATDASSTSSGGPDVGAGLQSQGFVAPPTVPAPITPAQAAVKTGQGAANAAAGSAASGILAFIPATIAALAAGAGTVPGIAAAFGQNQQVSEQQRLQAEALRATEAANAASAATAQASNAAWLEAIKTAAPWVGGTLLVGTLAYVVVRAVSAARAPRRANPCGCRHAVSTPFGYVLRTRRAA